MRLKNSDAPAPSGYLIRASLDQAERGPFSVEMLTDLADCGQVTTETLIRHSTEEKSSPLQELPQLMASVFPGKKAFQFKQYQQKEDPDAGRAPIDVRELYTCESVPPPPLAPQSNPSPPSRPALGLAQGKQDVKKAPPDPRTLLTESQALRQKRTRSGTSKASAPRQRFSAGNVFFFVRWGLALILFGYGLMIWSDLRSAQDIFLTMALGMIPITAGIFLVVFDVINWTLNAFDRDGGVPPPDYTKADARLMEGNWKAAADAYLHLLRDHPHETRAYITGIAAADAAGKQPLVDAFHKLAEKNLGQHDRNLLTAALRRRNLPPLPPTRK